MVPDECIFSITDMISTTTTLFIHDTFALHSSNASEKLSCMNITLFSFSGPMLDLFPLEIIPLMENIH